MSEFQLSSSRLGTKKYWDEFYAIEKENFAKNEGDTGENWFDESNAEAKMVDYIVETGNENSSILDLGTGNGHLLFELRQHESNKFANNKLIGIDYSEVSIEFAKEISEKKSLKNIEFYHMDFLTNYTNFVTQFQTMDFILDKGTLDAIALSADEYEYMDKIWKGYEVYAQVIENIMNENSLLVITSCNFSEEELTKVIEGHSNLKKVDRIEYPSIEFGGAKGSTICSVIFKLQAQEQN